jgi:hypothetical protein
MEKGDPKIKEYVLFQFRRKITNLYKQFLFILEDVSNSKYNISDESYQKYRKRILDAGNDTIRELEEDLAKLELKLKE